MFSNFRSTFLSQCVFIAILCAKMSRVTWALSAHKEKPEIGFFKLRINRRNNSEGVCRSINYLLSISDRKNVLFKKGRYNFVFLFTGVAFLRRLESSNVPNLSIRA